MAPIRRIFFDGLKVFLPFFVVALLVVWLLRSINWLFSPLAAVLLRVEYAPAGSGLVVALLFLCVLGLCMRLSAVRRLIAFLQKSFRRLPLVKTVFDVTSDVFKFFSKKGMRQGNAVMVDTPIGEILGIITREEFKEAPKHFGGEERVAVYFPMSYQIGGFTFLIKRERLIPLDITVEEAMALAMTAGVSKASRDQEEES